MAGGEDVKQPGMHLPGQGEMCSQVTAAVDEKGEQAGLGRTQPKKLLNANTASSHTPGIPIAFHKPCNSSSWVERDISQLAPGSPELSSESTAHHSLAEDHGHSFQNSINSPLGISKA